MTIQKSGMAIAQIKALRVSNFDQFFHGGVTTLLLGDVD
jgi:hypothetical protein